jgi:hypothetical protein
VTRLALGDLREAKRGHDAVCPSGTSPLHLAAPQGTE